jgi:branched-chain amino acid aminotransferase
VTPQSESILEGITRDSVLQLAEDRGHKIERRRVTLEEWRVGVESGDITEMFACGTAAVITPISLLKGDGVEFGSADAPAGELTMSLREELTDIQYGRREDKHGWMMRLDA